MHRFRPSRPSPALVISLIALFIALGGTGYAALKLPRNSVGTRQLKNNAVTSSKVKNGSLTGADLKSGSVSGSTINLGSLGAVPNATHAGSADNATNAQAAAVANSLGSVSYVQGNVVVAPGNGGSGFAESDSSTATCPAGTVVIGSGAHSGSSGIELSELSILASGLAGSPPDSIKAFFDNFNTGPEDNNFVIAICAAAHAVDNPSALAPVSKSAAR